MRTTTRTPGQKSRKMNKKSCVVQFMEPSTMGELLSKCSEAQVLEYALASIRIKVDGLCNRAMEQGYTQEQAQALVNNWDYITTSVTVTHDDSALKSTISLLTPDEKMLMFRQFDADTTGATLYMIAQSIIHARKSPQSDTQAVIKNHK